MMNDRNEKNEPNTREIKDTLNMCKASSIKKLGQYFTVSPILQQFVFDKVKHKSSRLLEPSFGAGHLLKKFKDYNNDYPMVCYELDTTVQPIVECNSYQEYIYKDFTKQTLTEKFKTIIGNPPYIKGIKGNLYLQFIEQCYNYLQDDGELIFIVPSNFIKKTSAASLIETMIQNGSFTDFLFPHDEKLFDNASIDVMVFRYEKGLYTNKTIVNGKQLFCNMNKGILTFSERYETGISVDEEFHVYVGLVSGKDAVFKVSFGNITILNDKNTQETYLFTESFPTGNEEVNHHLLTHKTDLLSRKIRKFNDKNWFEWGAPRNLSNIRKHWGKPCIYVKTLTRHKEIAFSGTVQYFGGSLLCLVPKKPMTETELNTKIAYFNSSKFQENYIYAGRMKIGHKQIRTVIIPV